MTNLFEDRRTGIASATGTVALNAKRSAWHNQLVISRGTATAGTLTIKYTLGGKTFNLKDQYGVNITMALTSDPEPVRFDGMVDTVVIEQADNNGTFDALLIGQTTS